MEQIYLIKEVHTDGCIFTELAFKDKNKAEKYVNEKNESNKNFIDKYTIPVFIIQEIDLI